MAELYLERGSRVLAIDALTDYYDEQLKRRNVARALGDPSYHLIEADLLALDLSELVDPVTTVFHLVAHPGVRIS